MGMLGYLLGVLLLGVPLYKLLPRAGMNPMWALVCLVPIAGIALLWVVAFRRWPGDDISERF